MGNLYLKKLRQKQPVISYGMDEDLLGDIYGVDLVQQPTKIDETGTSSWWQSDYAMKIGGSLIGLGLIYMGWKKFGSREEVTRIPTLPMASFNMQHQMSDLEKKIVQLLQKSKDAYDNGSRNVDSIVEPFAQAQEMIHTDSFKRNYETNPVKLQIVEDFTRLGTQLSG